MSLSDPTVTIGAGTVTLPRVSSGVNSSTYRSADGAVSMSVSHQYGKRIRRNVRIDFRKTAADPFASGYNKEFTGSVYLVLDQPTVGFTQTELKDYIVALATELTESSAATTTKILGGEN